MANVILPTSPSARWQIGIAWLRALLGDPIPMQTLAPCFDQLATLLNSSLPVNEAFRRAAQIDPELARIGTAIENPLRAGVPLHRALLPWKARLPAIVLPVLEVGTISGTLDSAAQRLAGAFGQSAALDRHYRNAVFNPWLVMTAFALYSAIFHFTASLPEMLTTLLLTFLQLALLYIAGRLLLRGLFRWTALRCAVDTLKLALPGMGLVARNLAAARWGRSFATLWNCGVPVSTALEVSSRSALNAHYERALHQAARRTREGQTLAECLADTQLLPRHLLEMVRTGEMTGSLGICLEQFASLLESEALTKASQQFVFFVTAGEILLILIAIARLFP